MAAQNQVKEATITKKVIDWINNLEESHGIPARAEKIHGSAYQGGGKLDIDAVVSGRAVKIEMKRPGGDLVKKMTELQKKSVRNWNAVGALAFVASSVEDVEAAFRDAGLLKLSGAHCSGCAQPWG